MSSGHNNPLVPAGDDVGHENAQTSLDHFEHMGIQDAESATRPRVKLAIRPAENQNLVTEPIGSEQIAPEPVASGSMDTEPVVSGSMDTEPLVSGSMDTEPVVSESMDTEPMETNNTSQWSMIKHGPEAAPIAQKLEHSRRVIKNPNGLTPAMRQLIRTKYTEWYPKAITIGSTVVRTDDIFDPVSDSQPQCMPDWLLKREKKACVMGFRSRIEHVQPNGSVVNQITVWATYVGPTIKLPTDDIKNRKGKGKAYEEQSGPAKDMIKVAFRVDSQTPHLQITTRRDGTHTDGSNATISTRIFAEHIETGEDNKAMVMIRPMDYPDDISDQEREVTANLDFPNAMDVDEGAPGNAKVDDLIQLSAKGRLLEISIGIKRDLHRNWEGLSQSELNRIRASPPGETTQTRDILVKSFDKADLVQFYIRCENEADIKKMKIFLNYLTRLLTVAKAVGNFWFYRMQLKRDGFDPHSILALDLPKVRFEVPYWLVKQWQFIEKVDDDGNVTHSNPMPYRWGHHRFFSQYPNLHEFAFATKIGVAGELQRARRDIRELVSSQDREFFRGIFNEIPGQPGTFVVQLWMNDDANAKERGLKMPGMGTRLEVRIDPTNPHFPSKSNMKTFRGSVAPDLFSKGSNICCLMHGPPGIFKRRDPISFDTPYPVFSTYIIDDVPHQRQMTAIKALQQIDPSNKGPGVDLLSLFFGDKTLAPAPTTWRTSSRFLAISNPVRLELKSSRNTSKTGQEE